MIRASGPCAYVVWPAGRELTRQVDYRHQRGPVAYVTLTGCGGLRARLCWHRDHLVVVTSVTSVTSPGIEITSWSWPCFLACAACQSLLAY